MANPNMDLCFLRYFHFFLHLISLFILIEQFIERKLESEQLDRQLRKRLVERINDFVLDEQTQPGPCWNVSFELEDYFRESYFHYLVISILSIF